MTNTPQTEAPKTSWQYPPNEPLTKAGLQRLTGDALTRWQTATKKVFEIATANGWSKAEASRRADMSNGTFNQWLDGTYPGNLDNFTAQIDKWLNSMEAFNALTLSLPTDPGFVLTRSAIQIHKALMYAQASPEMVIITAAAGCGKTTACRHFRDYTPHVQLVTMRPRTRSPHNMRSEIGHALGIKKGAADMLDRQIGERLQRNGRKPLLILDEAQNLSDEAVDQVRYFLDEHGCGIALVGNEESYTRFSKSDGTNYAQIRRRIGMRVKISKPHDEDIEAVIASWKIDDSETASLLRAIGHKQGALGQISKTLQLANMLASGEGRPLAASDVTKAWSNRNAGV